MIVFNLNHIYSFIYEVMKLSPSFSHFIVVCLLFCSKTFLLKAPIYGVNILTVRFVGHFHLRYFKYGDDLILSIRNFYSYPLRRFLTGKILILYSTIYLID